MPYRIAVTQMDAVPADVDGNIARIARLVDEAARGHADLAAVPDDSHLAFADIDPRVIAEVRNGQRMWADRRGDLAPRHRLDDANAPRLRA